VKTITRELLAIHIKAVLLHQQQFYLEGDDAGAFAFISSADASSFRQAREYL